MMDSIEQKIEAVKQEISDLKKSQSSCTTNVEKEYRMMELEDELVDLKAQLEAATK